MSEPKWQDRLLSAIEADGRSWRAISLAAGLGPHYISQMRQRGTNPTLDAADKLCRVLDISLVYILTGLELDPEGEEFLRLAASRSSSDRRHLIELLRRLPPSSDEG